MCIIRRGNDLIGRDGKDTMADDELDEDFDPAAIEEEIDEEALDAGPLDEDDDLADDVLVDVEVLVEPADEEVPAEPAVARKKKAAEEEEDDDDELDPDDVEADLDTILKDRIAAVEEEEDDEELEEVAPKAAESPDGVVPKKANEFTCHGCFLLVNRGQFGPENNMRCPVGESDCPAIEQLQATPKPVVKAAKAATRKR